MLSIGDECISPFLHGEIIRAMNSFTDQLHHLGSFAVIPDRDAVLNSLSPPEGAPQKMMVFW